jgi:hypothetical protein
VSYILIVNAVGNSILFKNSDKYNWTLKYQKSLVDPSFDHLIDCIIFENIIYVAFMSNR